MPAAPAGRAPTREAPYLRGLPGIGKSLEFIRDPLGFLTDCARHGDVVRMNLAGEPTFFVNHPALVEKVLVTNNRAYVKDKFTRDLGSLLGNGLLTSDGDFWRRQRRLAQPAFHRERIAAYGEAMVASAQRMVAGWHHGERRDAHDEMMRVTLEIVARTLFDADVAGDAGKVGEALEVVMERFGDPKYAILPFIARLPTAENRRYRRASEQLDEVVYRIIAARRAGAREGGDLLSMLLSARDEDGSRMSDKQLRDEALILFLAGHETTALALSFTWLLLSQNPAAEARLAAELRDVLGGRAPGYADVPGLRYCEWVIQESMRLYPPAWSLGREAAEDTEIDGYRVPKGAQVWISQWVLHRDPRFFARPESFEPERWADDLAKRLPRYAYFPFGGGPRLCIGNSFAMMEAVLLLATIAQKFSLRVEPGHRVELHPSITLRPRRGLPVRLARRGPAAERGAAAAGA